MNYTAVPTRRLSKTNLAEEAEVFPGNVSDSDNVRLCSNPNKIIYVRVQPSPEKNFTQVLLPVAISYETFLCKVCVALGVSRNDVQKVVKLPDILIKSTEDVIRIGSHQKLDIVLFTGLFSKLCSRRKSAKQWLQWASLVIVVFLFGLSTLMHARTEILVSNQLKEIQDLLRIAGRQQAVQAHLDVHFEQIDTKLVFLETNLKRLPREFESLQRRLLELENSVDASLKEFQSSIDFLAMTVQDRPATGQKHGNGMRLRKRSR